MNETELLKKLAEATNSWIDDFVRHTELIETDESQFTIIVTDQWGSEWHVPVRYDDDQEEFMIDCGGDVPDLPLDREYLWIWLGTGAQQKYAEIRRKR